MRRLEGNETLQLPNDQLIADVLRSMSESWQTEAKNAEAMILAQTDLFPQDHLLDKIPSYAGITIVSALLEAPDQVLRLETLVHQLKKENLYHEEHFSTYWFVVADVIHGLSVV